MTDTMALGVRLTPEVSQALDEAARNDGLTVSQFVEKLIRDCLHARGYIASEPPQGLRPDQLSSENDL
jgi:uncharacterized protein (DUF1778 family)